MIKRLGVCLLVCAVWWSSGVVMAQEGGAEEAKPDINALLSQADKDATRGRYKRAVPLYKEALRANPYAYPAVYYNLAEISRALENYTEAAILYKRYLEVQPGAEDRKAVEANIKMCEKKIYQPGQLTVVVEGPDAPVLMVNGIPAGVKARTEMTLAAGKYEFVVRDNDYHTARSVVEVLPNSDREVKMTLKKRTFFGTLKVQVNVEGAAVFVDGEELGATPIEVAKLEAGKHLVEFKKDGYHRWIRRVEIGRDEEYLLEVNMQKLGEKP